MSKLKELRKNKKGFTLMEMIVVIVIIGILLAILVPGIIKWVDKAKQKQVEADARTAFLAVQGAVLEGLEEMSIDDAIAAVDADKIEEVLEEAGVDGTAVINGINPKTGEIESFTFTETGDTDGKRKVSWNSGDPTWRFPDDPNYAETNEAE